MSGENRQIAGDVLQRAHDVIMKERKDQHGDAENSFIMIAEFWGTYIRHRNPHSLGIHIGPADVAHMMALLKHARAVYGDEGHGDHYVDAAGYVALAAMIKGAKP